MDILHFSAVDAMAELLCQFETWWKAGGDFGAEPIGGRRAGEPLVSEANFWSFLISRPGNIIGDLAGSSLEDFLTGMTRGGDWLQLPTCARARDLRGRIEEESLEYYGSRHALFRIERADRLLERWAP